MKPRRLAVYGLTAGLLGGGAAGLALSGTTLATTRIADVTSSTDSSAATDSGELGSSVTITRWGRYARAATRRSSATSAPTSTTDTAPRIRSSRRPGPWPPP